jgi:predicted amidohydrolase
MFVPIPADMQISTFGSNRRREEFMLIVPPSGIVPGTIVESHRDATNEEDKLLNVCYFIDHEGKIAGKYIKKNLWYVRVHATNASTEVLRLKLN